MSEATRARTDPDAPRPEPWFATLLRMLVHAITAAVIAWPLSVPPAVIAAALGAAIGALGGRLLARTPLRSAAIVLLGLIALGGVAVVRWGLVDLALVPGLVGPADALVIGDMAVLGAGALVVSLVLRALSVRAPSFTIAEAGIVATGFATLLVAHRHGAIHRPYELADPLISRGEDPTIAFLVVGACGAAVIGLLLLSERSLLRSVFHLGVVAALLLLILGTTAMLGLPPPPSTGGALGLQDDSEEDREARGQGGGQGRRNSDDLEFLDQYPSGGATPDAVVIFHDDYSAPGGYYYFRQNAFSQFNGRKLVAATLNDVDADVHNVFPTTRARTVAWTPAANNDRTTVETTVAMLADNSAPMGLEAPERFVPATNPAPQRFRRLYRVDSISLTSEPLVLLDRPVGDPSWSEEVRRHYVAGPDDPRYAELGSRIVSALPDDLAPLPVARALAITQYLGHYGTYSLESQHAGAEDPTADFLFGDLTGYCVHFAHAAVFLMRAAGVPARVGTGYAVAEANREGGSALLLRNSDQHAWPEVFIEGAGWVVFDVAPENVLDPPG
ncbi:MAG: transglutaminase family protein, partial [Sandaracinaceae bacterium]